MTVPTLSASTLLIREATPADDAQLCAQARRNAMPGRVSLVASSEPSFFAATEVEGYARRVVVGEQGGRVVGVGLMAKRRLYLNGEPTEVGYISSLRTDPSIRNTTAVVRGNRLFQRWHEESFQAPLYLCAILQENLLARRVLAAGRAGLPESRELGTLYTAAIPLVRRRSHPLPPGLRVVRGGAVGAEAVVEALNRLGRAKQFFPVYTVEEVLSPEGTLRGLGLDDFHVALAGDRVVGVAAGWDQLPFRRLVVEGYSLGLRLLRPPLALLAKALRLAPPPRVGEAVQSVLAACLAVEDSAPPVFAALLESMLQAATGTGRTFLLVGLMEQDPLLAVARRYLHLPTCTCIYALQWGGFADTPTLDDRVPYLELGSL